ncbi:hypothetical protein [Hyphomicrobium facile]|uniref:Uncharacterized protein n=1 Tax=Hyphomicrobium facile TaxID=51670 RepID=A0A1I7MTZ1_9HYPH|nr:hypothetical protein [Hyphomicrobium facile]SFV25847.1 hypothetical protein SAMN04488557_0191 [Hyphomicrobium facile]
MDSSHVYQPEALERMTVVLERAARELRLDSTRPGEKERLASCILSIGNMYSDVNRLLEKAVRLYLRGSSLGVETRRQIGSETISLC